MSTNEIAGMSKIERLRTMEAIWDSLTREEEEMESPDWHQNILEGRQKDFLEGKVKFFSLEEVKLKHSR